MLSMSEASTIKSSALLAINQLYDTSEQQRNEIVQLKDEIHQLRHQLSSKNGAIEVDISVDDMVQILHEIDGDQKQSNDPHPHQPQEKKEEQNEEEDEEEHEEEMKKTKQFWVHLDKKLKESDIDYVKELIRNNEIKMDETNEENGRHLLMMATAYGSFELVSMCINLGADIDKQDKTKKTALKLAKEFGFPDIEELLLMNLLKTELGKRIENTTNELLRKKAINNHFKTILNDLFGDFESQKEEKEDAKQEIEQEEEDRSKTKAVSDTFLRSVTAAYKHEVLETLNRVTLKCIENRTAFSDDIMYIAFQYEIDEKHRNPTDTMIYKTIKKVLVQVLSNTKDTVSWYWLKHYVLTSSIWYIHVNPNDDESDFLWRNLFEWVEKEATRQSQILSEPMRMIESEDLANWTRLVHYSEDINVPTGTDAIVRQDRIDKGLTAEYTKAELTQNISLSGSFNPITHYDLSQYLTKLILISHEYDDWFQSDIQKMFGIDGDSKRNKQYRLRYIRGPVKKLERCYAKCQSDYRNEAVPTAAHVLDIVRCTLIFDDVSGMLDGMDLFQKRIATQQFHIKQIVRIKNGFEAYSHDNASYTDIKFNVLIAGKTYSVIAEVQFLLQRMADYKKVAHSLYSVQRTKEFVDDLKNVLPIKTNLEKQLFIHAARNNVNGLCDLMVSHGFDEKALVQLNQQKQSIMTTICARNCEKTLRFLMDTIPIDSIRERLMLPDQSNTYPLRRAIENNHHNGVLKTIFENDKYFDLIHHRDHQNMTPLNICWNIKKGKIALLILQNIQSLEKRLELIDATLPAQASITVLQYALRSGDYECVSFIFDQLQYNKTLQSKLLCAKSKDSKSNFHFACEGGNAKCIELLFKYQNEEAQNPLYEQDYNFQIPVFHSILEGKAECADFVLSKMSNQQKEAFFTTRNRGTHNPINYIDQLKQSKEHIETLFVMVNHLPNDNMQLGAVWLFAARHNEIKLANSVLNKISNDDYRNKVINYQCSRQDQCAMHECCYNDNRTFLRFLLSIISEDNPQFTKKNSSGSTPLIVSASRCHITCCKLILNKIKHNTKLLHDVLKITDQTERNALQLALNSKNKNNEKCAKLIMSYYDDDDIESIFLPCLELGNIELAKKIWTRMEHDKALQNKLLNMKDKSKYNCFLLVCKKGRLSSLEWLLHLNNDQPNEAKEDETNLTQKHPTTGATPLILCVENDVRTPPTGESANEKELTDEQKDNYAKCVKLIFSKVQNKKHLLFDVNKSGTNAFMYAALNGNIEIVVFMLSAINEKYKKLLANRTDNKNWNCFDYAISGGNLQLVIMIYEDLFKAFEKEKQITNDPRPLKLALQHGYLEIVEWILTTLITDDITRIRFFNDNIHSAKVTRTFTEHIKTWIAKIVSGYDGMIHNVNHVSNILKWCLTNANDLSVLTMLLSKLPKDNDSKAVLMRTSQSILYSAQQNKYDELKMLLNYLDGFIMPVFECDALIKSVEAGNDECVDIILRSIKNQSVKNSLIEATTESNQNALMKAINIKSKKIIELISQNHSNIHSILGDAFISAIKMPNVNLAKMLLTMAGNDSSSVLNHMDTSSSYNYTALMFSSQQSKTDCLKFVVDELENDLETGDEKNHDGDAQNKVHAMYLATDNRKENVFHVMFRKKCSSAHLQFLESVLDKDIIRELLLSRNIWDDLPIYNAFLTVEMNQLQWILQYFDDPLERYNMITQRNKYDKTLLSKYTNNKSKGIQEAKTFIAQEIMECMEQIDFNNLEFVTIKDVFQYTITWKCSELQSRILSKMDNSKHKQLYNRDNMLECKGYNPIHLIIKSNDPKMCNVILSANTDYKCLISHSERGRNPLTMFAASGVGEKVISAILDKSTMHKEQFLEMVASKHCNARYSDTIDSAMSWIYATEDAFLAEILHPLLPPEMMYMCLLAAVYWDKECKWVPSILEPISSKDIKGQVLHTVNAEGETCLLGACRFGKRKVIEYLLNYEELKQDDLLLIKADNKQNMTPLLHISTQNKFYDIFANILSRLTLENKVNQLLRKAFDGRSVITGCVKRKVKDIEKVVNDVIVTMSKELNVSNMDQDTTFALFQFAVLSKHIETVRIILHQTPKSMQNQLFSNYEDNRSWNVLKQVATQETMEMFAFFVEYIENIVSILKDESNPNCNSKHFILRQCCIDGNIQCFQKILSVFDEHKEECDPYLQSLDEQNKSLLSHAIAHGFSDIAAVILQRIEHDSDVLQMLNAKDDKNRDIFNYTKSTACKDLIKTAVINILKNIKANDINSESFNSYFHWLCAEGDIDSTKQLLHVFNNDQNYIRRLLKSAVSFSANSPLHIVCEENNAEFLKYLLQFVTEKQQMKDLFSSQNKEGMTPLMYTIGHNENECFAVVLNMLKANKKLLSEVIRIRDKQQRTCIDREMSKNKIMCSKLIPECDIDEETLNILVISSIKQSKTDFADQLILQANAKQLFRYVDGDGCNALFYLLSTGNTNITKRILSDIDKSDETEIGELVAYKNYKGQNLMHAACKSANIYACKLVMTMCQFFQHYKKELLSCADNDGNNPLHVYLQHISGRKPVEIKEYITWYLSNIKRERDKLAVLSQSNLKHIIPLNCTPIKTTEFGAKLFANIISNINCRDITNTESWSSMLHLALESEKNSLSLVKLILNKYESHKDKLRLLSVQNHLSQNAFYLATASAVNISFLLSFINGTENENQLLLERSCSAFEDGKTLLHNAMADQYRGPIVLEQFASKASVLFIKDDENKSVLNKTIGNAFLSLAYLKELSEKEICQLLCEQICDNNLFCYLEDHADELVPKLLSITTEGTRLTVLMNLIIDADTKPHILDLIIPYIRALNDDERLKFLSATNYKGETVLHYCADHNAKTCHVNTILSLFPSQQAKETAILSRDNWGYTAFMNAFFYTYDRVGIAYVMWNNVDTIQTKLRMFNLGWSSSWMRYTRHNLKDWIKNDLIAMKSPYIENVLPLTVLFRLAALHNDVQFARLIVSKINVNDKEKILTFVTTKIMAQEEQNCLHFAAKSQLGEMIQILFDLLRNIEDFDLNELLSSEALICDKFKRTPLHIACTSNHPQVVKCILSQIDDARVRLKLIAMEGIEQLSLTAKNYKNKNDRERGVNCVWMSCALGSEECLHQLSLSKDEMKQIIQYKNNKNETICNLIKNRKIYRYLTTHYDLNMTFEVLSRCDVEGDSVFMTAVRNGDANYVQCLLDQCTDEEKLKLIYHYNEDQLNVLDFAQKKDEMRYQLVQTIKRIISSQKTTDLEGTIIPIFLWSLKCGNVDLCKWLLSNVNTDSDKIKVVNGCNAFGLNTVLSCCQGGQMVSLQYLLSHRLFSRDSIFKKDDKGLTAIHYACFIASTHSISCLKAILSFYAENEASQEELIFMVDELGNIPFDYIIRKCGIDTFLSKWILRNAFQHIGDKMEVYRHQMMMLFHQNNKNEIALIERLIYKHDLEVTQCIKRYFESIKVIDDSNVLWAASSLLYLRGDNWTVSKLILSKVQNKMVLHKILDFRNSDNETILSENCNHSDAFIIEWYLAEVVPKDHPCLFTKNESYGTTALRKLIGRGYRLLAQQLLDKITEKEKRLHLIQMKNNENKTVLDLAKENGAPRVIDWIQNQLV
eukprot:483661_1